MTISTALVPVKTITFWRQTALAGLLGKKSNKFNPQQTQLLNYWVGLSPQQHSPRALKMMGEIIAPLDNAGRELVMKAYEFVNREFAGILRKSGKPFIDHLVETAQILVTICESRDSDLLAAALLHDYLEDIVDQSEAAQKKAMRCLAKMFGREVAELVDAETELRKDLDKDPQQMAMASFKKWLSALAKDPRIAVLKAADRLSNMKDLHVFEPAKRHKKARETEDIYVPIMHAMGVWEMRLLLERLALHYLQPKGYAEMAKKYQFEVYRDRQLFEKLANDIKDYLEENGIFAAQVTLRQRDISEVYRSMARDNKTLDDYLNDNPFYLHYILVELRGEAGDCFDAEKVLGQGKLVGGYIYFGNKTINYLANPRLPGQYRALQLFLSKEGKPGRILLNIVTQELNRHNRLGFAALPKEEQLRLKPEWIMRILHDLPGTVSGDEMRALIDEINSPIFVFDKNRKKRELSLGATVLDYIILRETGKVTLSKKVFVNDRPARLDQALNENDSIVIELMTGDLQIPRPITPQWLRLVRTVHSAKFIRGELAKLERTARVALGIQEIEEQAKLYLLTWSNLKNVSWFEEYLEILNDRCRLNLTDADELPATLGRGLLDVKEIGDIFMELYLRKLGEAKGKPAALWFFEMEVPDRPGILHELTEKIKMFDVNIRDSWSFLHDPEKNMAKIGFILPVHSSIQRDQAVNMLMRFKGGSNIVHKPIDAATADQVRAALKKISAPK